MKLPSLAFAAAAIALSLPTAALAGPTEVHATVLFWAIDKNGDGAIDKAEADALRAVIFDAMDTNHDGRLTKEEAGAAVVVAKPNAKEKAAAKEAKKRDAMLAKLDLAKPEGIAKDEFVNRNADLFAKADADKNGKLSAVEFVVLTKDYAPLMPH